MLDDREIAKQAGMYPIQEVALKLWIKKREQESWSWSQP
jgi:hypothetical protein